ncbi:hypothetical protein M378DRAFT_11577 [Amanita muscaria Koide BX008]|uniref:Uncharacterized protein n=1 Tax=Amanita muscaria (strain Koide BX008) TaxID=946122 RepID=A0A0C2WRT0_AMAMK|nr:hypothetical protein M378DRAFT_11577 [Amanita muscaria Koide BX008]
MSDTKNWLPEQNRPFKAVTKTTVQNHYGIDPRELTLDIEYGKTRSSPTGTQRAGPTTSP